MCMCVSTTYIHTRHLNKYSKPAVQGLPVSPKARYHNREMLPGASPPSAQSHSLFCSPNHLTVFMEKGLPLLPPAPVQVTEQLQNWEVHTLPDG